jgi:hypothetical protein
VLVAATETRASALAGAGSGLCGALLGAEDLGVAVACFAAGAVDDATLMVFCAIRFGAETGAVFALGFGSLAGAAIVGIASPGASKVDPHRVHLIAPPGLLIGFSSLQIGHVAVICD